MKGIQWFLIAGVVIAGCGQSAPRLAPVTGEVKLNGQPLPQARVVFQPTEGAAKSPSVGETGDDGSFRLAFNRDRYGAIPGEHKVHITTARTDTTSSGQEILVPERLPPQYNAKSELKYTIEPGSNHFEISLQAPTGAVYQTDQAAPPVSCP